MPALPGVNGIRVIEGGFVKLTSRGESVIATAAIILILAIIGLAGWVEGGMQ